MTETPRLMRTRLVACGAAVLTVAAGLGLRSFGSGDVAKYGGDALYTALVYVLVVLAVPRVRPRTAAAVALAFSVAVELLQLTGVPAELAARSTAARLVLGSTFNAPDLLWYAVGAAVGWGVHAGCARVSGQRASRGRSVQSAERPAPVVPGVPGAPRGVSGGRPPGP
ncbi:DUF2809 domain-containing protein [Streptomyces sp. NPDC059092]|uniref:ribosomal maturation YjgA family protein n=1 Tax=Streptomyces sp. NPDC059092 TaxID=3346725 RepID=UPI0036893C74